MLWNFSGEERRENVRQVYLARILEIAARPIEILRHHAEVDAISAQYVTQLTQHFGNAHVRAGVTRAVVSRKQKLQLFAGFPTLAFAKHPAGFRSLDDAGDPRLQNEIHHAADPPAFFDTGHSW
jgi:hypothetical protein